MDNLTIRGELFYSRSQNFLFNGKQRSDYFLPDCFSNCINISRWKLQIIDLLHIFTSICFFLPFCGRCGRDHMVGLFITTCVIRAYHHYSCEFETRSWWGVFDTTLCDKVFQWLVTGRWFSPGIPVSSANKTNCYHIYLKYCWKWR